MFLDVFTQIILKTVPEGAEDSDPSVWESEARGHTRERQRRDS